MKFKTVFLFFFCNIFCNLKFKIQDCGVYEECMDVADVNLRKGVFEIELDSIKLENKEVASSKTLKIDDRVARGYGICSFEDFKNVFDLRDIIASGNSMKLLTRTFKLIVKGKICNEKHCMISGVRLRETRSNEIILSSDILKVVWDKENPQVTKQCVDYINSFLESNGSNLFFKRLRRNFRTNYDENFVSSMNMMKRCVENTGFRGGDVTNGIENLRKMFEEDVKKLVGAYWKDSDDSRFIEVFSSMGALLRQMTKVENFPYLSIILLSNSLGGEIKIHRSISIELEDLPKGRSLKDYELKLYDTTKRKMLSEKFNWYEFEDKVCLSITELINNGVKYLGATIKKKPYDIHFIDLEKYLLKSQLPSTVQ